MVSNYAKETDDVLLNVIACDTVCDLFMHVTDHRKSEQIVVFFQSSSFQILKPLSISCEIITLNSWRGIAFSVIYGFLSKYQENSCVPTSIFFCCLCFSFVWRSMSFLTTFTIKTFLSEEKACFLKIKRRTTRAELSGLCVCQDLILFLSTEEYLHANLRKNIKTNSLGVFAQRVLIAFSSII